jgi:ketosteroid isomerase-like protein
MSEMVRMLQRGYEMIWREGRIEDALIGLGPDFEWVVLGHPDGEVRHGPDAVIAFFHDWIEPFDDLHVDWQLHEVAPGAVLALIEMRARGKVSGAPVEMSTGQLWTFREGRFVGSVMYHDADEARRAGIVHKATAAYGSGDFEAVIPFLAEDVVWEEDPDWPDGQTWHGHDGVRRSFGERLESTNIAVEIDELAVRGDRALTLMSWTAEGVGGGAVAVLRPGVIYEFDRELVKRARLFIEQDRAREAFESG